VVIAPYITGSILVCQAASVVLPFPGELEKIVYFIQMAGLLSPREAALRLGISYPTMKQWLYRGKLKAIKTPGGHYRIPEAELDSLLHKARRPETPKRQMLRTVSGRNQLVGRIVEIKVEGLLAQIKLSIGGQIITSLITADAARELQLEVGETAAALIKSTEVMLLRV
jgi:molybdopterin-binding protein